MQHKLSDETNPADWFYLAKDRLHAVDVRGRRMRSPPRALSYTRKPFPRKPAGWLVFWSRPSLARPSQPTAGMLRPRRHVKDVASLGSAQF